MTSSGSVKEATAALEELRRRRPEDPRVMAALAEIRLKLGDAAGDRGPEIQFALVAGHGQSYNFV